jgi:hypothetical protein
VPAGDVRFGGGAAETAIHPAVLIALILACLLILVFPRKSLYLPFLLGAFLIPFGEVIVVSGIHFLTLRILILAVLIKMATSIGSSKNPVLPGGFNRVDVVVVLWALAYAVAFVLLYAEFGAVINRLGFLLDALGGYFVVRYLIQDMEDVQRFIKLFAIVAVIMAICMVSEQLTHRNVFGFIGGERLIPELRADRTRSQAAFHHPLLAGAFGATLVPLLIGIWKDSRKIAIVGLVAAVTMAATSAESTSVLTLAAGIGALCLWPLRNRMRAIRWGIVIVLVGLQLVMKAPVWALIARIDLTGSSTSFDRFILIDNCIRHFSDWWLLGVKDYNSWGFDMWDLCNQYVAYAETGGLATLVFFIAIIARSFGFLKKARLAVAGNHDQDWFLWCLWAALFSHVVGYFGLGYGDQMQFSWFALLAMISVAALSVAPSTVIEAENVRGLQLAYPGPKNFGHQVHRASK